MAYSAILAGRNLLTERPVPDKRFSGLSTLSSEIAGETKLVALTYDTRHLATDNVNGVNVTAPILVLAGDTNRKIYFCHSETMKVITSFNYPTVNSTSSRDPSIEPTAIIDPGKEAVEHCYGLATMSEPTDCLFAFLGNKQSNNNPILYYLRYVPNASDATASRLEVVSWHVVDMASTASPNDKALDFNHNGGRGISEYRNDLLMVSAWKGVDTIVNLDYKGMPLAYYPSFTAVDKLQGVQHINGRVYTTIDMSDTSVEGNVGSRVLAKFLTDRMDRVQMIPLASIEPFFFSNFNGDITIFQDRMAACFADNVYTYKMCYFMFIVDDLPNDDIDMGSILIGDSKTKRVVLKNVADIYKLKDISITVDKTSITDSDILRQNKAKDAADWVKLTTIDPSTLTANSSEWQSSIALATAAPYVEPDGEREFWCRVEVPETYSSNVGSSVPVTVDDGPFIVPLVIRAKVG